MTSSTVLAVTDALNGVSPVALPAAFAALGVAAVFVGTLRRRNVLDRADAKAIGRIAGRAGIIGYLVVAFTSFSVAGLLLVETWQMFNDARWDAEANELVLVRWGPIPDIHVDPDDIVSVTEVSLPARGVSGDTRVIHLVLHTVGEREYWSAPFRDDDTLRAVHHELTTGTSARIDRFEVGGGRR